MCREKKKKKTKKKKKKTRDSGGCWAVKKHVISFYKYLVCVSFLFTSGNDFTSRGANKGDICLIHSQKSSCERSTICREGGSASSATHRRPSIVGWKPIKAIAQSANKGLNGRTSLSVEKDSTRLD